MIWKHDTDKVDCQNQFDDQDRPHGYWDHYMFTTSFGELHQEGLYVNGIMKGKWKLYVWTKEQTIEDENLMYYDGQQEGEDVEIGRPLAV